MSAWSGIEIRLERGKSLDFISSTLRSSTLCKDIVKMENLGIFGLVRSGTTIMECKKINLIACRDDWQGPSDIDKLLARPN